VNYPGLMDQKTACELAAPKEGYTSDLDKWVGLRQITPGPCPPKVTDNNPPILGPCPPSLLEVTEAPIVNLCRTSGGGNTAPPLGVSSKGDLPPGAGPPPASGPTGTLLKAYSCPAGYDADGNVEVFLCWVWGSPGSGRLPTNQAAFERCVQTALLIMQKACDTNSFQRFPRGCSTLAQCYE
jgi:hypothetical protein